MSDFNMANWLGNTDGGQSQYDYPLFKMQEGVTYQIRILDAAPTNRYVHFDSIPKKSVICPGTETKCLFCMMGKDPAVSQSYVNILDRMDGKVKVHRFGVGRGFGAELVKLLSSEGDPLQYDIRVVRTGTKKETRYALARVNGEPAPSTDAMARRYNLDRLLIPMPLSEMEKFAGVSRSPAPEPSYTPPTERKITTFDDVKKELTNQGADSVVVNPKPEQELNL